jgi:hypothetical protein
MSSIKISRIVLPGLAAGLLINVSEYILNMMVLGSDVAASMQKLGLPAMSGAAIGVFVLFGFAIGITLAWLYAAVRPRLGPGPMTASCIGSLVWFLAYLYGSIGMMMMGVFPVRMVVISLAWGLVEVVAAANVAGYLYKEPA